MQLSSIENISEDNIVFHEKKEFQLRNTSIKYKRIKIETKLPNGKISPLVVETPFLFSFGVSKRKNQETGELNGYSIPVCLWKKDQKPNQEEQDFFDLLSNIQDICRNHLAKEYSDNEATCLGDILYYKQIEYTNEKGKTKKKIDKSRAPVLYVKLIYSDKTKKILSIFRTKGKTNVNPLDYLDQYFNTKMAIVFESIYISKKVISLQIKAHEVYIKPLKPRESILEIKESDDEEDFESENEEEDDHYENDEVFED